MGEALVGREEELRVIDRAILGREQGVALVGPTGIGTTALLDHAADRATSAGLTVVRVYGSPVMTEIPFGAIADLVPDDADTHPARALRGIARAVTADAGPHGVALVVDDADVLDDGSIAVLHTLAAQRVVRLVLAITDDLPVPASLSRLWRDRLALRHDVTPLDRPTSRSLLESMLGGSVADDAEREVWKLAAGHPLYVEAIASSGALGERGGLWRLERDPLADAHLVDLVEPILSTLGAGARRALSALAWTSPLSIDLLDRVAGDTATAELEANRIVNTTDGRAAPRHPLLPAVARATTTTKDRRAVAGTLAAGLREHAEPDGGHLVRAVTLELDAGLPGDPQEIARAAEHALEAGDYATAARLGGIGNREGEWAWRSAFVLGQALRQQGDGHAAERAFVEAIDAAPTGTDTVNITVARAHNLALTCGDFDGAVLVLAEAADDSPASTPAGRRLAMERTFLSTVAGDFREIAVASSDLLGNTELDDLTRITAENAHAFSAVMLLRVDHIDVALARARPLADRLLDTFPLARDQLDLMLAVGRVAQGRIPDAVDVCVDRRARGMDQAWGAGDGAWTAVETFARTLTVAPDLPDLARRTVTALRSIDPLGLRHVGTGIAAIALLQTGNVDEATRALESVTPPVSEGDRRAGALVAARVEAWRCAHQGDLDRAAAILATAASSAIEHGHLLWGMLGMHDAVRFGRAETVLEQLHELRRDLDAGGGLLDAMSIHAEAAAAGDPRRLELATDRFLTAGATRFAVESAAQAAVSCAAEGDRVRALRLVARAQTIAGGPLPLTPTCPRTDVGLTPRQAEVVRGLVDGRTAREIAGRLSLSVRTVENHIAAAHRALDVSSRQQLIDVVAPTAAERPPERPDPT